MIGHEFEEAHAARHRIAGDLVALQSGGLLRARQVVAQRQREIVRPRPGDVGHEAPPR